MIVYRLQINTDENAGEGEDHTEWFSSLAAARKRRAVLIRRNGRKSPSCIYDTDHAIHRVTVPGASKTTILEALNRSARFWEAVLVVPPHVYPGEENGHN